MALSINEECIACGACVETCPVDAIVEAGDIFTINSDCTECQACVDSCPVGAIVE